MYVCFTFTSDTEINQWHSAQHSHHLLVFKVAQMLENVSTLVRLELCKLLQIFDVTLFRRKHTQMIIGNEW